MPSCSSSPCCFFLRSASRRVEALVVDHAIELIAIVGCDRNVGHRNVVDEPFAVVLAQRVIDLDRDLAGGLIDVGLDFVVRCIDLRLAAEIDLLAGVSPGFGSDRNPAGMR